MKALGKLALFGVSCGAGAILACLVISEGIIRLCNWED
jgi:hypothetical protein